MNVLIPTCGESPYLIPLLHSLQKAALHGVDVVHVAINNVEGSDADDLIMKCREAGASAEYWGMGANIYKIWNSGIEWGRRVSNLVAILNDDVEIPWETFLQMERAMRAGNWAVLGWDWVHMNMCNLDRINEVSGTYRKGGVGGFAFCVDPSKVELIDERFQWWGGDDDLVYQTLANGHRVGVAVGLGVKHHYGTSSARRPFVYDNVAADRQLMLDKWGESW